MNQKTFEEFNSVPGFTFEYYSSDDSFYLSPSEDRLEEYIVDRSAVWPAIEGADGQMMFEIGLMHFPKDDEIIAGVFFMVDGKPFEHTVNPEYASAGMLNLPLGIVGTSLVESIISAKGDVRVSLYYKSGNVDFLMTDAQIGGLKNLFSAFENVGGYEENNVNAIYIDMQWPIAIEW